MNPMYGVDYTFESYEPTQVCFGPLNVKCPICRAELGQPCKDRNKGHAISETHRARRSRAKKLVRVLEKEQQAYYCVAFGREALQPNRPNLNSLFFSDGNAVWHKAFSLKQLDALRGMHRAQMEFFKRKLRGEDDRGASTTSLHTLPKTTGRTPDVAFTHEFLSTWMKP